VLVSEQILTLSGRVSEITNKAYAMAPMLVSDLTGLSGDLRGLYEAVLEIEPSREDIRAVEARLYRYPTLVAMLAKGKPEWWDKAFWIDNPSRNPCEDRVQGGASVALAQRIAEARDELERDVDDAIIEAKAEVANIEQALDQLPRKLEQVIRLRYFEGMCWYDIAEEAVITRRWAFNLRDEALLILSRALKS
jgi:hypothetical protein